MELMELFLRHLGLLLGIMFGMTTFKVVGCKPFTEDGEDWSWRKFLLGVAKQLIVLLGCFVVFFAGCKCGEDLLLVEIGANKLTVQGAVDYIILAVTAVYAAKFIINFAEFAGLKDRVNEKNVKPILDSGIANNNISYSCINGKIIGYIVAPANTDNVCEIQACEGLVYPEDFTHCK